MENFWDYSVWSSLNIIAILLLSLLAGNLVYQNFSAIVFGFPMMLLATLAPKKPELTMIILVAFFIVMNVILFRAQIFKRRKK